jgi:uncharacterized protein
VNVVAASLLGGAMIGAASGGLMLLLTGHIAGISGILGEATRGYAGAGAWRLAFLGGLVAGGLLAPAIGLGPVGGTQQAGLLGIAAAGLLVGIGTRVGHGCTSGHGVCGLANLSPRSLLGTGVFMLTGGLTVFVVRHVVLASHVQ